ncbi:MAG: hypothetical protein KJO50_07940, partial [Bacteroidia bacterium]|nr:hypothetical protein [Bacteroidia bacterium]
PGTGNNCQWLQGIIPVIGGGWDQNINSLASQEPMNWMWLDEGNVDYNAASSVLSIGNNPDGDLTLEYGTGGIMSGDLLPGGWWYTSPGGTGCTNDGDPDNMYGLETPCGMTAMITHCFELTVRNVQDINDCSDNFYTDLNVTLFNLADGETGCYDDVTCSGDTPVVFNGSIDCTNLLDINVGNREICSGDFADIPISITDGFEVPVSIEVMDMGNTSGAKDWVFEKGSGIIPDQIINLGDQAETVIFEATLDNSNSLCQPPVVQFELLVQPELKIDIEKNHIICEGSSLMVAAPAGYDSYNWYDPDGNLVSQTENLEVNMAGDYQVVVTQGVCQVEEVITVSQISELPEGLNTYELTICNEYIGTHPNIIDLTSLQNQGVEGNWFDENNILIADPTAVDFTGVDAGIYIYTFETTNAVSPCPNETYQLVITVEDCECPSLEVMDLPTLCAQMNTLDLSDFEITTEEGTWSIVDGPDVNSIDLNGDLLSVTESSLEGDYTLSFKLDDISNAPACNDEVMVVLSILAPPFADLINQVSACNAGTGDDPDIIDLDDLYISGSDGSWISNDGLTIDADNNVVFTGLAVGTYSFTYTTNDAVSPCNNVSYDISISVADCSCPPIQISQTDDFCQVNQIFDLTTLIVNAGPGSWSLSSVNTLNTPTIVNNSELYFTGITAIGDYTLTYTLDDQNIPTGCDNAASVDFTVIDAPFVVLYTEVDACNGFNGNLEQIFQLDDLIQGGSGGGIWSTNEPEITIESDNSVSFLGVPAGFYDIDYTTNHAEFPCMDVTETVTFTVRDCACPIIEMQQFPDLCIGSDTFDLTTYLNTNAPGEWYINGIVGTNAIAIIDDHYLRYSEFAEPGEYVLSYELYNLGYDADCSLLDSVIFNIYANPESELLPDTVVCNMDIGIGPDRIF